jgi:hypothetical protein
MSVQELGSLHQRYIDLSERFRAAWTFHQFLQGLAKVFLEGSPPGGGIPGLPADFQEVYGTLKEISQTLNASETGRVRQQLESAEQHLEAITIGLVREDSKISPSLLRQFFQRVRNYDERILTQLIKFYLYAHRRGAWSADDIDKADFLLTKLGEASPGVLRERTRLRELLDGLWAVVGAAAGDGGEPGWRGELDAIRLEIAHAEDVDELADLETVRRYRELKHGLRGAFFEPETLLSVLETNLALKSKVRQLYAQEERRIFDESQRIFALEREAPVDPELAGEVAALRRDLEQFERGLQHDEVRLEALTDLKHQLQSLLPRLAAAAGVDVEPPGVGAGPPEGGLAERLEPAHAELIGEPFRRIVAALEDTSLGDDAKAVSVSRSVFALRLEAREVTAYRRLAMLHEGGDGELERFLLESAALRLRSSAEAEEIMGILDESGVTREAPVFARAGQTTRLADRYVRRFSHFIDQAVQEGNVAEAQVLQVLRMRLIRDYSGLWLLLNR